MNFMILFRSTLITVDFRSLFKAHFSSLIITNYIAKIGILRGNIQSELYKLAN